MNTLKTLLLLFVFAGLFAACDDNPVDDDHDDHADVEGLVLEMNGVEIVRVQEGVVTGQIAVEAGEETDHIEVVFLDHDGDVVHVEDLDEDLSFGWEIASEAVAELTRDAGEEYAFHILGKQVGTTTVELGLMHGDHFDFRTPDITIVVSP